MFRFRTALVVARILFGLIFVVPVAVFLGPSQPAVADTWAPVYNADFPDPSVSLFGSTYYAYSTQVGLDNVPALTSTNAVNWTPVQGDTFPTLPIWAEFGFTWAPTVEENASGQYVMFYTARDASNGLQCIGRALSLTGPLGPFLDTSLAPVICQTTLGGSIDPNIYFDSSGNAYLLWKSDGNSSSDLAGIWAQPLDTTLSLIGVAPTLLLVNGGQAWQGTIIEGPSMVNLNGSYYLLYSGNNYDTAHYAIGYTTCAGPLGPCANTSVNPVLSTTDGVAGPGGEDFFTGPSGQTLMAFAGWPGPVGYAAGGHRAMYMASVSVANGIPVLDPYNPVQTTLGYWQVGSDGGIFTGGSAQFYGSTGSLHLNKPIVGMAATPDGHGYWLVASDGGVFAFGDAQFYGSTGSLHLNKPIVGMASTPDGLGYWLVASDGGIFAFGDAAFAGSTGSIHLNKPIVGMAVDQATGGYWLVASDGGVFSFNAPFFGSTGAIDLAKPVVGMAAMPDGSGYYMVAADGGVFAFNAPFDGSAAGQTSSPVVSITLSAGGDGYLIDSADGAVFNFGSAPGDSSGPLSLNAPIVSMDAALH